MDKGEDRRYSEVSGDSQIDDNSDEDENDDQRRKSSFGFDEYEFTSPLLDDNQDAKRLREEQAEKEAEKFLQMARLKTTEYSKMDVVHFATSMGGLNLDETLVEPVPIPETPEARAQAVHEIYGSHMDPESEPFKDPLEALESNDNVEMPEKIQSPSNLYDALQSNFLKSNYKSALYRLFLIGKHDEHLNDFIDWNKDIVESINVQSYTEPMTGVLCAYEYYYIHILEGSEDNLTKLMQKYADNLERSDHEWNLVFHHKSGKYSATEPIQFRTVKSWVLGIFRIQQRQLNPWRGEKVFPNKMTDADIPPGGFREKYFHFIRQCMVMAFTYNRMALGRFNPTPGSNEELTEQLKRTFERAKFHRCKSLGRVVTPITFIEYILKHVGSTNTKLKIRSIREHLDLFTKTPPYISSWNTEWPPPSKVAPYD